MRASLRSGLCGVAAAALGPFVPLAPIPTAWSQPCPDVEVVFARGTGEPAGIGPVGASFVDALRPQLGDDSLGVYSVNYPATNVWATGIDGIRDASDRVMTMASSCPETKMVLGGFSQGAAVMGFVTSTAVPDGVDPASVPKPLLPEVSEHVAAVVLFGKPNGRAMNFLGQPSVVVGQPYAEKTTEICAIEDPVCSDGLNFSAHNPAAYHGGLAAQAATFTVGRLRPAV